MNPKNIQKNLLNIVFKKTLEGETNFHPDARLAIKETSDFLKKGELELAEKAAKKTVLSLQIFQEAKKLASITNKKGASQ